MDMFGELYALYDNLQNELLAEIAERVAKNPGSDIDEWHARVLAESGMMQQSTLKKLSKILRKAPPIIENSFKRYGLGVFHKDEKIYRHALQHGFMKKVPIPNYAGRVFRRIVQSGVNGCSTKLNLVHTTALESSQRAFRDTINRIYVSTALGDKSFSEAAQTALRELADQGISGVTYRTASGRMIHQTVDVAVRNMVTTSYEQMGGDVQIQMANDLDSNFVETSSHMGARPSHAVWQGQVFQLEGNDRYPNFYTECGYGEGSGIKGYNCHHDFYPYFPGASTRSFEHYNERENNEQYAAEQTQRGYERQIRKYKRRQTTAQAAGQTDDASRAGLKVKQYQKIQREHVKNNGLERDYSREK